MSHPRDRFITVYGRKPALEALADAAITIDKLWIATTARGEMIDDIIAAARARGVRPERRPQHDITRLSRNGRQDQGIALDVIAPRMIALADFIAAAPETAQVMLLDGVTTPGNVGLILRVATAAGFDGVVLPRVGCPEVGPLVIKASAGVAFRAPIVRAPTAGEAAVMLGEAGFTRIGLAASGADDLYRTALPARAVWVLGGETAGVSAAVEAALDRRVRIPMRGAVESLNVATAAAVVAFEVQRRLSGF